MTNTVEQTFTDVNSECFKKAFAAFKNTGDFLKITRDFEHSFNAKSLETAKKKLSFDIDDVTVSLIDTGVLLLDPIDKNLNNESITTKNIIISSGIHGNETAPIEIVQQLIIDIISTNTQVKQRTLFIIGNPVSMNISKRFEVENLNRLFCGKYKNIAPCFEKDRAEKLETYVTNFFNQDKNAVNYHYDLHTAIRASKYEKFAIYPFQGTKAWDKEQLSFMQICGVSTILFGHGPTGTFSYFSSANFNAHAFTIELGKVKPFGENNMENFSEIKQNLANLISQEKIEIPVFAPNKVTLFKALGDITKNSDNFTLFVADEVSNFTAFPIGTLLATDTGLEYKTKEEGESIIFPNANVGNGQRAALMVAPTVLV